MIRMLKSMKNKGYTLIEVIFTISLMTIILSFTFTSFLKLFKVNNSIESRYYENATMNFILKSKSYCRANEISGRIVFDVEESNIFFEDLSKPIMPKVIYTLKFPNKYKISYVSFKNRIIYINSDGTARDYAGTIQFKDKNKEIHTVTMRVGSSYVDIK